MSWNSAAKFLVVSSAFMNACLGMYETGQGIILDKSSQRGHLHYKRSSQQRNVAFLSSVFVAGKELRLKGQTNAGR